jgi:hypothetical protein
MTLDDAIKGASHLILVGMPRDGKSEALAAHPDNDHIDVAREFSNGGGKPFDTDDKTVVLDNFEYQSGKPDADEWRLKGLETLVFADARPARQRAADRAKDCPCYGYRPALLVWAGRGVVYAFGWTASSRGRHRASLAIGSDRF